MLYSSNALQSNSLNLYLVVSYFLFSIPTDILFLEIYLFFIQYIIFILFCFRWFKFHIACFIHFEQTYFINPISRIYRVFQEQKFSGFQSFSLWYLLPFAHDQLFLCNVGWGLPLSTGFAFASSTCPKGIILLGPIIWISFLQDFQVLWEVLFWTLILHEIQV